MPRALLLVSLAAIFGCKNGEFDVGKGAEYDARLVSDVYTWDCNSEDVDWMGVLGFNVSLEFVPDALPHRDLPPMGSCSFQLSMFAEDALNTGKLVAGEKVPGMERSPRWASDESEGRLLPVVDGFWYADVFKNTLTCQRVDQVITGGIRLFDAGVLEDVTTPSAGTVTSVSVDEGYRQGIPFGQEVGLTWDVGDWQESFVQIRRVRDRIAYETVTCNTTGQSTFDLDNDVWDFLSPQLGVDYNFLYVGFQNTDEVETEHGQKVRVDTRALHVVGVSEID